jgi:hypothetical protein
MCTVRTRAISCTHTRTQLNTGVLRQARLRLSGIGLPVPAYSQSENIPTQVIADKIPITLKGEFAPFSFVHLLFLFLSPLLLFPASQKG